MITLQKVEVVYKKKVLLKVYEKNILKMTNEKIEIVGETEIAGKETANTEIADSNRHRDCQIMIRPLKIKPRMPKKLQFLNFGQKPLPNYLLLPHQLLSRHHNQ